MGKPDYVICTPSRKRAHLMNNLRRLLPTAIIVVDEAEADDYLQVVPKERLMFHPGIQPLSAIRQWILENRKETCVLMCDDDLQCVFGMTRMRRRTYKDGESIRQIIESTMTVADDLDIPLFCWAATARPMHYQGHCPIRLVAPAMGTFGIIGRDIGFDTKLFRAEDVDISMQTLQSHRILYQDARYKFYCGGMFYGTGGHQGNRSAQQYAEGTRRIKQKWGDYVLIQGTSALQRRGGKAINSERVSIRVSRKSKMANFK